MKYILLLVLALSTTLVSAQRKPRIKGSRTVVEITQSLPPYKAITLLDDLELTLERSSSPGYIIEADDNLIDVLKFHVDTDTLFISSFYNITAKKKLDIRVLYTELEAITLKDGRLSSKEIISADHLGINTSGTSRLQLNTKSAHLQMRMSGQSAGEYNLDADSIQLVFTDRADARIYQVSEHLKISMKDQSDLRLEGSASRMEVELYDNSELKAERSETRTTMADLDHSASAHLRATDTLELSSRRSADTYFYGDGKIIIHDFRDTSRLNKRAD